MRSVYMTKGEIMSSEKLTTNQARQAETRTGMRTILIVSTLMAIVVMSMSAGIFAVMS
jgi:hypothetical protein